MGKFTSIFPWHRREAVAVSRNFFQTLFILIGCKNRDGGTAILVRFRLQRQEREAGGKATGEKWDNY